LIVADSEVQELDAALGVRVGDEFFTRTRSPHPDWRQHYADAVPASVAEKLATALERVRSIIGSDELHAEVERVLAEYRVSHLAPVSHPVSDHGEEGQR
jgi:hypothetical protein